MWLRFPIEWRGRRWSQAAPLKRQPAFSMLFLHLATEGTNHVIQAYEVHVEKTHLAQRCSAAHHNAEGSTAASDIR